MLILYYPEGTHTSSALFSGKAARAARCPRLDGDRPTRMEYTSRGRRHLPRLKIQCICGFRPVRSRMKTSELLVSSLSCGSSSSQGSSQAPQMVPCPPNPQPIPLPSDMKMSLQNSAAQCQLSPSTFVHSAPFQPIRRNFLAALVAC